MFEKPLGLRENPFLAGHNPKYLFPSREHQEALAHLRYGIQNREPFVLITGEVGTGKTTAVYDALAEWGSRAVVALITNSALTRSELLEEICLRFGLAMTAPISKPQALVELQRQLSDVRARGELAILLVDEAQNLDRELLEEIRLLSNLEVSGEYLLQIFLVGQPELESKLAQKELRQLRQRIGIHYRILPLSATETARYIHHRVSIAGGNAEELFPAATCVEIFRITNGIPREINIVAGQSLLNAFVEDSRSVTIEHVRSVEREIEFQSVLRHQGGPGPAQAVESPPEAPAELPPAPAAALQPMTPVPTPAQAAPAREVPAPPATPITLDESDLEVEVTESTIGEPLQDVEEALSDEFQRPAPPRRVEEDYEETSATGTGRTAHEPILPSWIDEIVTHRQTHEGRPAARSGPPAQSLPPPASVPPWLTVLESDTGRGRADDAHPSPAMVAAPAPERPPYQPPPPLPLFDRRDETTERLPARLRNKLTDEDEEEEAPVRRSLLGWPVASVIIAAIAVAVLLVVRFGPWTSQPRSTIPAGTPAPAAAPDTMPATTFPPFEEAAPAGGATQTTTVPIGGATTRDPRLAARPPGTPAGDRPGPGPVAPEMAVPAEAPAFGIAIGTYLNEGRAIAERARIGESTRLESRVVTVSEDSVSMYRVVVGSFADRIAAERAASDLVQRGLVGEARVVAVAKSAPTGP